MKYCLHCDWYASRTDGYDAHEQSREAIDHFLDTGHAIDSMPEPSNAEPNRTPEFDAEGATRIPVTGVRDGE